MASIGGIRFRKRENPKKPPKNSHSTTDAKMRFDLGTAVVVPSIPAKSAVSIYHLISSWAIF